MILTSEQTLLPGFDQPVPGFVRIEADRIVAAAPGKPPTGEIHRAAVLSPGFVDVHCHGGGGSAFDTDIDTVIKTHLSYGTTTMVASLVTASYPELATQIERLALYVSTGELAGIHLEGPWLSAAHKGAHTESLLRDPVPEQVRTLLASGGGTVKMVTMAPELPGAIESIRVLAELGCLTAIGHTDADYRTTLAAIAAGARGATHLFNGMPELLHRNPGPVLALCGSPEVWLELIFDGAHLDPALAARIIADHPTRAVLVTDAMAAAGAPDGDYTLGGLPVVVRDQIALLADGSSLAGSTLTMDRAVRTAVRAGVPLGVALRCASANPARYLELDGVGEFRAGGYADAVLLDEDLTPVRILRRGTWL